MFSEERLGSWADCCDPSGVVVLFSALSGGVASLNPRLIAGNPTGLHYIGIGILVYNDECRSVGTIKIKIRTTKRLWWQRLAAVPPGLFGFGKPEFCFFQIHRYALAMFEAVGNVFTYISLKSDVFSKA